LKWPNMTGFEALGVGTICAFVAVGFACLLFVAVKSLYHFLRSFLG
jgi:hypothetical protein